jgi:hypothetical protein
LALSREDAAVRDEHARLAIGYFDAAWEHIEATDRSAEQNRDMLTAAFASRQHWIDADGKAENLAIADWQVAHAASLAGWGDVALVFARSAVDRAESNDVPTWLKASTHEGLARAHATAGETDGYTYEADLTRALLEKVADPEDRALVASQLASIPAPHRV